MKHTRPRRPRQARAVQESIDGFHRRLKMQGYPCYADYLRSKHWREVKRLYRTQRPWECGACGKKEGLHLHHRTYENLGAEQAFLWQLVPLCTRHHVAVHRWSYRHEATIAKATRTLLARSKRKPKARVDTTMLDATQRRLDETNPRTDADAIDRRGVETGQSAKNRSGKVA